jgi:hypothetical protein
MYLCYIDESGTPDVPGSTSHFILAGVSIPIWHWHDADREVSQVLGHYALDKDELHTAWLLRSYAEQRKIPNFEKMDWPSRRAAVIQKRTAHLLALQKGHSRSAYRQAKKNYAHTHAYVHLTHAERISVVREVADKVSNWGFARLFAECIDKVHFDPVKTGRTIDEQAFEQIVSRFEQYLKKMDEERQTWGLLVHDNNETMSRKHTSLMRDFHSKGTLWTRIQHIIETPLFVNSSLTSMVQVADLCSYALRRYVENGEEDLFERVFKRADRYKDVTVGVRHFAGLACKCIICVAHTRAPI